MTLALLITAVCALWAALWAIATAGLAWTDNYAAHVQAQLERRAEFDRRWIGVPDMTVIISANADALQRFAESMQGSAALLRVPRALVFPPPVHDHPPELDAFTRELVEQLAKPMVVMADPACRCTCHRVDGCFFVWHTRDCCPTPGAKPRPEERGHE